MGRRRKEECSSSSSDYEDEYEARYKVQRRATRGKASALMSKPAATGPSGAGARRPVWFWAEFNQWWRDSLERNGKRPNKAAILQWYNANAVTVWEHDTPSYTETRMHAKCLRSTEAVRLYFRRYRAARREHDDDEGGHSADDAPNAPTGAGRPAARATLAGRRHSEVAEETTLDPVALVAEHNRRVSESHAQAQAQAEVQLNSGMPKGATVTTSLVVLQQPGATLQHLSGAGPVPGTLLGPGLGLSAASLRSTWGNAVHDFVSVMVKDDPDSSAAAEPLSSIDSQPLDVLQIAPSTAAVAPALAAGQGGAASSDGDASSKTEPDKAWTQGVPPRFAQIGPAKRVSEHSAITGGAYGSNEGSAGGAGSDHECSVADARWASAQVPLQCNIPAHQQQQQHLQLHVPPTVPVLPQSGSYVQQGAAMWPSSFPGALKDHVSGFPFLHPQRFLVHGDPAGLDRKEQGLQGPPMGAALPGTQLQRAMMVPLSEVGQATAQPLRQQPGAGMLLPQHLQDQHIWRGAGCAPGLGPVPADLFDDDDDAGVPEVFYDD